MSRPLRIEFVGVLYHVTSRGDGREDIYPDDADRDASLEGVPVIQRRPPPMPLAHYQRNHATRDEVIVAVYDSGGSSTKAIGDHFGSHYSMISRFIKSAGDARALGS